MAKTSILTIMIQLAKSGNADREVIKGLAQLKSNITGIMGVMGSMAGAAFAVDKAFDATVGTFVSYAAQVRELQRLTGASAEDTSRLIQAADDTTIAYESLQKALWFAAKNGVEVNIESIARLADEYVALESATERADFLAKKFGKGGAEMGKLLEQGASGVRRLTDATADGLVMTQDALQAARAYEIQVDTLTDSWTAFKTTIGQGVIPVVNQLLVGLNNTNAIRDEANRLMKEGIAHNREEALTMAVVNLGLKEQAQGFQEVGRTAAESVPEIDEATQALDEFHAKTSQLGDFIQGDLGKAWDDYNSKITEYRLQLEQARGEEEKREIQAKIDAETEAYNRRATAIMFNIQQQAIMAAVESDPTRQIEAIAILGQLAEGYGLIDERQKLAMNSSASLVEMWLAGTYNADQLTQQLAKQTAMTQASAGAMVDQADKTFHAGQRALDTVAEFDAMTDAQAGLGDGIRSNALPAVGNLSNKIASLPPTGTSWEYQFNIAVSGRVPTLPSKPTGKGATGFGSGFVEGFASGGKPDWANEVVLVGDAPGGGMTPYTEAIINGYVFDAKTTQEMWKAGLFTNAEHHWIPGDIDVGGGHLGDVSSKAVKRRRSDSSSAVVALAPPPSASSQQESTQSAAEVVAPIAEATQAAVQTSAAAQQQQVSEGIQTRNVIAQGNEEMAEMLRETNELLRNLNTTLPRSIAAAFQQANP